MVAHRRAYWVILSCPPSGRFCRSPRHPKETPCGMVAPLQGFLEFDGSRTRPARRVGLGIVPLGLEIVGENTQWLSNTIEHIRTLRHNTHVERAQRRFCGWSSTAQGGPFGTGIGGTFWTQGRAEVCSSCLGSLSSISQTDAGRPEESWESRRTVMGDCRGITLASAGPHNKAMLMVSRRQARRSLEAKESGKTPEFNQGASLVSFRRCLGCQRGKSGRTRRMRPGSRDWRPG